MSDTKKHIELAYGLLWHVTIDTLTSQGRLVSDARKALSDILADDERCAGIAAARDYQGAGRGAPSYQSATIDRTPTQRALDAEAQVVDLARENERLREALSSTLKEIGK